MSKVHWSEQGITAVTGACEPGSDQLSDFGVVVLNYNDYRSTLECVHSLRCCNPRPGEIVVVDNRSQNESLQILQRELNGLPDVIVHDSGRNGGYSYGNNAGIHILRRRGARHVLIATSDTKVISTNLFDRLQDALDESVGAVGPQIRAPGGFQNPCIADLGPKYLFDIWWVQRGMPGLSIRRWMRRLYRRMMPGSSVANPNADRMATGSIQSVYKLHGAFICLSDAYLTRFEGLDDRIFLFGEEDLLAWQCLRAGLRQRLVEDVFVYHADDSSIDLTWGDQASTFVDREQRKSGRILKAEISVLELARSWLRSQD